MKSWLSKLSKPIVLGLLLLLGLAAYVGVYREDCDSSWVTISDADSVGLILLEDRVCGYFASRLSSRVWLETSSGSRRLLVEYEPAYSFVSDESDAVPTMVQKADGSQTIHIETIAKLIQLNETEDLPLSLEIGNELL